MLRLEPAGRIGRGLLLAAVGAVLLGVALGLTSGSAVSGLPAGWGGALGLAAAHGVDSGVGLIGNPQIAGPARLAVLLLFALAGLGVGYLALGPQPRTSAAGSADCSGACRASAAAAPRRTEIAEDARDRRRAAAGPSRPSRSPSRHGRRRRGPRRQPQGRRRSRASRSATAISCRRSTCLSPPPEKGSQQIDRAGLERNARLLETVLEDFNVRGDIVEVRPGPVVTMYELEPASGIKASRVIALADDIARNMSALSARVATIPGRSVIGIELPNPSARRSACPS